MLARYKCSNVLGLFVRDKENSFATLTSHSIVIKYFFFGIDEEAKIIFGTIFGSAFAIWQETTTIQVSPLA